jgi:ribosome-associated protein
LRRAAGCTTFGEPAPGRIGAPDWKESPLTQHAPAARAATSAGTFVPLSEELDGTSLLSAVLASLEDDKAEDIITIPLAGKSEMADHMVIASGRSSRQVSAISEHLADRLKQDRGIVARTEGKDVGDWVLIDAGDVIVHVFRPEVREFYQLEKMWQPQAGAKPQAVDTV